MNTAPDYIYDVQLPKNSLTMKWSVSKLIHFTRWRKTPVYRKIAHGDAVLESECRRAILAIIEFDKSMDQEFPE